MEFQEVEKGMIFQNYRPQMNLDQYIFIVGKKANELRALEATLHQRISKKGRRLYVIQHSIIPKDVWNDRGRVYQNLDNWATSQGRALAKRRVIMGTFSYETQFRSEVRLKK